MFGSACSSRDLCYLFCSFSAEDLVYWIQRIVKPVLWLIQAFTNTSPMWLFMSLSPWKMFATFSWPRCFMLTMEQMHGSKRPTLDSSVDSGSFRDCLTQVRLIGCYLLWHYWLADLLGSTNGHTNCLVNNKESCARLMSQGWHCHLLWSTCWGRPTFTFQHEFLH